MSGDNPRASGGSPDGRGYDANEANLPPVKCPLCKAETPHRPTCGADEPHQRVRSQDRCSHHARMVFVAADCAVCLEDRAGPPVIALACGHCVCPDDFQRLGGKIGEGAAVAAPRASREQQARRQQEERRDQRRQEELRRGQEDLPAAPEAARRSREQQQASREQLQASREQLQARRRQGDRERREVERTLRRRQRSGSRSRRRISDENPGDPQPGSVRDVEGDGGGNRQQPPTSPSPYSGVTSLVAVPGSGSHTWIPNHFPRQIVVTGAGVPAVNGTYHQTGDLVNGACCYGKIGFSIIRDIDGWSISIVFEDSGAGTPYYKAAVHERRPTAPPRGGWLNADGGEEGAPTLEYPERSAGQVTPDTRVDSSYVTVGDSESHQVAIAGAGIQAVNGMYCLTRYFQGAGCYTMSGWYFGARTRFYLFCCDDATVTRKHWYISAVPPGLPLGTSRDVDFYVAPVQGQPQVLPLPPREGWIKAQQRDDDAIALEYVRLQYPVHDALTPENLPSHRVVVTGAGPHAVNGIYRRDCDSQEPQRAHYVMEGPENGPPSRFHIFQRRDLWFLSSVPEGVRPGTPGDFDLYIAPAQGRNLTVPPRDGWLAADGAAEGAPTLAFCA